MNYVIVAIFAFFPIWILLTFQIVETSDFIIDAISYVLITGIFVFGRKTLDTPVLFGLIALIIYKAYEFLEEVSILQALLQKYHFIDVLVGDVLMLVGLSSITFGIHRMFRRQQKIAELDSLTNTYNKRAIEHLSKIELNRSLRNQTNTSLILIDVDHFKRVNDKFGHQVGDKVLIMASEHIQHHIRGYDILARWGGDEFVVICPNTSRSEVEEVMLRLQKRLPLPISDVSESLTLSLGASTVGFATSSNFTSLFTAADKALYSIKRNGRNSRCHFESLSFESSS